MLVCGIPRLANANMVVLTTPRCCSSHASCPGASGGNHWGISSLQALRSHKILYLSMAEHMLCTELRTCTEPVITSWRECHSLPWKHNTERRRCQVSVDMENSSQLCCGELCAQIYNLRVMYLCNCGASRNAWGPKPHRCALFHILDAHVHLPHSAQLFVHFPWAPSDMPGTDAVVSVRDPCMFLTASNRSRGG